MRENDFQKIVEQRINEAKKKCLTTLDLTGCQLTHIPQEVFELTQLTKLDCGSFIKNDANEIKVVPKQISLLENLEFLFLTGNQLTRLPKEICQLKKLKYIYLSYNQLVEIPAEIGHLHCLQLLDLGNNRLSALPTEIAQLKNLVILILDNNPLEMPPPEIVKRGLKAIKNYLGELEKEIGYLYEIKLLLVGEGRVGKTSLAKSLSYPNYQLEAEQSTEGIQVKPWVIPKEETKLKRDFKVNIWDFGGQEIYHSTHQFFLTKRSLYILVTESRQEDKHEDFYYWLNIIRLLGANSPVLIVLNKFDEPTKDLPILEYRKSFDNIIGYKKVSCKKEFKSTIEKLKLEIKQIITNKNLLPHIGTPLPKVWVTVRVELEELRQSGVNYISMDNYLSICKKKGMDKKSAFNLSEFFHDLGVILHFKDDLALRETVILNPEWVTKGVYNVLDNEIVKSKYGTFDNSDLIHIWKDEKYKDKRMELLSLMKNQKFELCYELGDGKYLAPQLLPVDEIEYEWRTKEDNFHFEYRYRFMPKGILSRIIVKRHKDIYQQTHWRYGVLLEHKNTRAIIKEKYFDRKIAITLEGHHKKEFLAIIRKTVQDIHSDFNNLKVQEMISCNCQECKKDEEPHFYEYTILAKYEGKGKSKITCSKSLEDVEIFSLMENIRFPDAYEKKKNIFISYSHNDIDWLRRIEIHLKPLVRDGVIDVWNDTEIMAGAKWEKSLEDALNSANIALLLISADFLASDFIINKELPILLKTAEYDGSIIIPIVVKPSRYTYDEILSQFQAINDPRKPLIDLSEGDRERVFVKLTETIKKYLK